MVKEPDTKRSGQHFVRNQVLYALVLLVAIYYVVRLPLFLSGAYLRQIIPGFYILSSNPLGIVVCLLGIIRKVRIPWLVKLVITAVGLLLSLALTMMYGQMQRSFPTGLMVQTCYMFASSLVVMPWLTVLGYEHANRFAPLIFKTWEPSGGA